MARQTQSRPVEAPPAEAPPVEAPTTAHPLPSEGGSFMWVDGVLTRVEEAPEAPVEGSVETPVQEGA